MYITNEQETRTRQLRSLRSVMMSHGVTTVKGIGLLLGKSQQSMTYRVKDGMLRMDIYEFSELVRKKSLTDEEIVNVVRGRKDNK